MSSSGNIFTCPLQVIFLCPLQVIFLQLIIYSIHSVFIDIYFQALEWIRDYGEAYLASHTNVGGNKAETEQLLKEHYEFRNKAKVRQSS